MKIKTTNKKQVIMRGLLGALLIGCGGALTLIYGKSLTAGLGTIPNSNPVFPQTQNRANPSPFTTSCLAKNQQKEYLKRSIGDLTKELIAMYAEIVRISIQLEQENTTPKEELELDASLQQIRYRIELLLKQKTGRERELQELLRLVDEYCSAPA